MCGNDRIKSVHDRGGPGGSQERPSELVAEFGQDSFCIGAAADGSGEGAEGNNEGDG